MPDFIKPGLDPASELADARDRSNAADDDRRSIALRDTGVLPLRYGDRMHHICRIVGDAGCSRKLAAV